MPRPYGKLMPSAGGSSRGGGGPRVGASFQMDEASYKAVRRNMQKLGERTQRYIIRNALKMVGRMVVKRAKQLCPKGAGLRPNGEQRKHLKQTIKTTSIKWYRNSNTFAVVVGNDARQAPHAHLVHNGTAPHTTVTTKPLLLNGRPFRPGMVFHHPGARPTPYLADAVEQTRSAAQAKMTQTILEGIARETAKLGGR